MKIFICGIGGRMGEEICSQIEAMDGVSCVGGIDRSSPEHYSSWADVPGSLGIDVVIDFSLAEGFSDQLQGALDRGLAFVSGTTGLSKKQFSELQAAAEKIPVFWSANMAPGVHIMKQILKNLQLTQDFDVQMTEHHHIHKKDKPSGTALLLQEPLKGKGKSLAEPISIRGGGIFGRHKVECMAPEETITIEHQALSRGVFARGALQAACWISSQKPGLYRMDDYLI